MWILPYPIKESKDILAESGSSPNMKYKAGTGDLSDRDRNDLIVFRWKMSIGSMREGRITMDDKPQFVIKIQLKSWCGRA